MTSKSRASDKKNGFENAAPALKKHLISSLSSAVVQGGIIDVWSSDQFHGIQQTIAKYRGRWLSEYDVNGIIIDAVFKRMQDINAPDEQVALSAHVSALQIDDIADEIVSFLKTIPRNYDILFPLPQLQLMSDFVLSGAVSFVSRPVGAQASMPPTLTLAGLVAAEGIAAPSDVLSPAPRRMYLKVCATGYTRTTRAVSAMHDAMALLKRTIQVGVEKRIFHRKQARGGIIATALRWHDAQPILEALVYDTAAGVTTAKQIKLGLGMSSYLNDITVPDLPQEATLPNSPTTIEEHIIAALSLSIEALSHPSAATDTAGLRSAFEWAFDAAADDEAIGGCIKTCIALEAALGEDSEERGITERIADRVGYLIGTNPENRKELRDHMRNFYKLRSNLVHGKQSIINPSDHIVESTGRTILKMVLSKEMAAIDKWWRARPATNPVLPGTLPS